MLVEMGAVERCERPVVAREVRGNPVEDDADTARMQPVDERAEIIRRPEARRGRVIARDLIAPGTGERVLHDRHELDVRETEILDVVPQLVRELEVREGTIVLEWIAAPRAEMHLVDRDRRLERVDL